MAGNLNCYEINMEYFEYICPVVCFVVCVLHSIIESVLMSKQNKKIDGICEKCLAPVESGSNHSCDPDLLKSVQFLQTHMTSEQLSVLVDICMLVGGDKYGNSN